MIEFCIYYGAALLLPGGPLVLVLWDVLVTEPRKRRLADREDDQVCYEGLPVAVAFEEMADGSIVATAFETRYQHR